MNSLPKGLTFDDVCLVPAYNNIPSRLEPDLSTWLCGKENHHSERGRRIGVPILAANMDTVINEELADILIEYGSVPIFHRFTDYSTQKGWVVKYRESCFISSGVNEEEMEKVKKLLQLGAGGVCIDIAHGHSEKMKNFLIELRRFIDEKRLSSYIIAGNVCTEDGYLDLASWGADAVKVGVGCGAACSTRVVTGYGVPQFTAIKNCITKAKKRGIPVIADGGIRGSADIVKALAAGACSVMIGKLFALTEESASEKRGGSCVEFIEDAVTGLPRGRGVYNPREAKYRGQASADFQNDFKGGVKEGTVAEGVDFWAPVAGTARELLDQLLGGLRSGMTYGAARHIPELQRKAEFMEVNSGSYIKESYPRSE